jgi:FixJ family two-component response regulator
LGIFRGIGDGVVDLSLIIPSFVSKKEVKSNATTRQTRKESFDKVSENLGERQKSVLSYLINTYPNGASAKELAVSMFNGGLVPSSERNSVHPRLNELVSKGLVKVVGTKTCQFTDRKVAIYKNI